jgi:sarcosine oxidase subunit beta
MSRILIVGGGIIGVASAYFLGRSGHQVILLERQKTLGELTTAASMQAVRAQFSDPANIAFMQESLSFYEQFGERLDLPGHDIGFHQQGYLFVTGEEAEVETLKQRVALQHQYGLTDVEFLADRDLRKRFPYLAAEALAGTFRARDGWLSAHEALLGFRQAARRYDVTFQLRTTVERILKRGDKIIGVASTEGNLYADHVVLTAGPFTAGLAQTADMLLPLDPMRRHRLVIGEHALIPGWAPMTIDHDTGAHWRPEGPGAALAWAEPEKPSPPALHVSPDPAFPFRVLEGVYRLNPFWLDVAETLPRSQVFLDAGQYTVSPDHNPLIGPAPEVEGLWISSGFSGHGVMATPAAARLLADLIDGTRPLSTNPFALDRPSLSTGGGENMLI